MRECKYCGAVLRKESRSTFCTQRCSIDYNQEQAVSAWKEGKRRGTVGIKAFKIAPFVRRYMIEKVGGRCQNCGWNTTHPITGEVPLEIHHLDGDFFNTVESNLEVLCPNCHSLTETYRGRNKGNGRKR